MECEAGKQLHLTAPSDKLFTSASAIVREVFKLAPAKLKALGLLGGGVSALTAGYLAAEFLESFYDRRIDTLRQWGATDTIEIVFSNTIDSPSFNVMGADISQRLLSTPYGPRFEIDSVHYQFDFVEKYNKITAIYKNGIVVVNGVQQAVSTKDWKSKANINLFTWSGATISARMRLYKYKHIAADKFTLQPALDDTGRPCMVAVETGAPFYNLANGEFAVGLTLAQARKLGKLPAGGGTLTVSLPSNWQEDEGVLNAKAEAEAKGWQITVQTYEAEAGAAATFALRRIWVRKQQNEGGSYVAADGSRWSVDWCVDVWGADPQELGYEPYRSVDAAVAYWELVPYVYPDEELLTVQ
jgi:hypothetical protein